LSNIDLDAIFRQGRDIIKRIGRPRDLAAAKAAASNLLGKYSSRYVLEALQELKPKNAAEVIGAVKEPEIRSKEEDAKILAEINELADAPRLDDARPFSLEEAGSMVVKRSVPIYRGK
jgi:hypothetical protein